MRRRLGQLRIDALEIVGPQVGKRATRRGLARTTRAAGQELEPLVKWDGISDRSYATYTGGANSIRLHRLRDVVPEGARILDIGIGYGYVTGVLLRDAGPAYYCGVDLRETFLDATRRMLAANELPADAAQLEVLDLNQISEEFIARHRPDLILLLEVLEHVADPVSALHRVSAVAAPGTQLLFTVPLWGRLEGVWGHLSLFNRARLEQICETLGLQITRMEPVANHWALVIATVGEASPPVVDDPDPEGTFSFTEVPSDGEAHQYERRANEAEVSVVPRRAYVDCTVTHGEGNPEPAEGGLRFAATDPSLMRLDLELTPPECARRLSVRGLDSSGEVKLAWVAGEAGRRIRGERATYVLKPGTRSKTLHPREADPSGVQSVEVVVEVEPGQTAELKLYRAAYVSGVQPESRLRRFLRRRFAGS